MRYRVITLRPPKPIFGLLPPGWTNICPVAPPWVESIRLAITSLSDMPGRCPIASEYRGSDVVVRQLVHGRRRHRYRILFEIGDGAVRVLRAVTVHRLKSFVEHAGRSRVLQLDSPQRLREGEPNL